mmetsp:Transcript_22751/g.49833  ORF Transcript_22751/g.49833 Transcript_22751/m.49833 type:complete len:202 (-) Transcript_22751:670-1275(-)
MLYCALRVYCTVVPSTANAGAAAVRATEPPASPCITMPPWLVALSTACDAASDAARAAALRSPGRGVIVSRVLLSCAPASESREAAAAAAAAALAAVFTPLRVPRLCCCPATASTLLAAEGGGRRPSTMTTMLHMASCLLMSMAQDREAGPPTCCKEEESTALHELHATSTTSSARAFIKTSCERRARGMVWIHLCGTRAW